MRRLRKIAIRMISIAIMIGRVSGGAALPRRKAFTCRRTAKQPSLGLDPVGAVALLEAVGSQIGDRYGPPGAPYDPVSAANLWLSSDTRLSIASMAELALTPF